MVILPEPVDFMTAIKAYDEGKTIYCEIGDATYKYTPKGMSYKQIKTDDNCSYITSIEILKGKWYIKE